LVVLDADVLVPNSLRDILLRAAEAGFYEVRWSATVLVELERALLNRILAEDPGRAERVQHLLAAMRAAFPTATVVEHQDLLARLTNDPEDRHVVAAAVQSGARTIVTKNVRHFPQASLAPYHIAAVSPDRFLRALYREDPARVLDLLIAQGADLRRPRSLEMILSTLEQHAPSFAKQARDAAGAIE
jgi:predicted nucleic acid-binding protein